MADSRIFSQNALGDNAKIFLGDNHVTVNATTADADKLFLRDISQIDPIYDKKDILMRKDFREWYCAEKAGAFWIKGDPGKGKTMLLCGIIEELEEFEEFEKLECSQRLSKFGSKLFSELEEFSKLEESEKFSKLETLKRLKISNEHKRLKWLHTRFHTANVVYFFCQAADFRANTAAAVIRGLMFSLLKVNPLRLKPVREEYGDRLEGQLSEDKALAILCSLFQYIVRDQHSFGGCLVCVVDALDECIKDCDHLLNLIIETSDVVKWLISSRNEKLLERKLAKTSQTLRLKLLELEQNAEHVSIFVDKYIDHHIQEIIAVQDDDALQARTSNILKIKAGGTFLWAALVVEQLRVTDHWQVEDVLTEMPEG
ncbi:hypothetical protein ACHAO4_005123 [Trichoderma viride]